MASSMVDSPLKILSPQCHLKKSASKSDADFQIPKILPVWVFVPLKCLQNLIAIKP